MPRPLSRGFMIAAVSGAMCPELPAIMNWRLGSCLTSRWSLTIYASRSGFHDPEGFGTAIGTQPFGIMDEPSRLGAGMTAEAGGVTSLAPPSAAS